MTNLEHALKYLERGFSVVPVPSGKKFPLIKWEEYQKKRPTSEQVTEWWTNTPNANIAIITGAISGITVVDTEFGCDVSFLPYTSIVKTGGGGYHYYYSYTQNVGNKVRVKDLVDIRNDGGLVIAPPSIHASGNTYEWVYEADSLSPFPIELFNTEELAPKVQWEDIMSGSSQGSRNDTAAKFFGRLLLSFKPEEWEAFVWPMGCVWNKSNTPPLSEWELRNTFESIAGKEKRKRDLEKQGRLSQVGINTITGNCDGIKFLTFSDVLDLGYDELLSTNSDDVISFGYNWLDDQLTGLFPGELVVIGGEAGTGKTLFATNIIYKASRGHKCAVYALEDRLEDYGIKALYFRVGQVRKEMEGVEKMNYDWNNFRKNSILDKNFPAFLKRAKKELSNSNIIFAKVDCMMNIDILETLVEEQAKMGVELFLIDHLHYFDLNSASMSKADYIETIMVRLRTLQRKTGARILLVVHYKKLNGLKPTLDSFKDSISIVQNANYVINIWRDRTPDNEDLHKQYKTYFYIPKSRNPNGEGMIEVEYDPATGDYKPLSKWAFGTDYNATRNVLFGQED